jgi:hypothetical protein
MTRYRPFAAAAGLAVLAGALIMLAVLLAQPGSWLAGYVSEAGTAGRPFALAYRSGLVLLGLGVALLGVTLRPLPFVGVLLWVAAGLAGLSGVVPCSSGCPLPPYEPTTVADVVHTAASVLGMIILAGVMVAVAVLPVERQAVRRLALGAAALTVPLGGALGLTMLFVGRSTFGAELERLVLVVAVSWLVGTASLTAVRPGERLPAMTLRRPR